MTRKYEIKIYTGSSLDTLPGRTPLSNTTDNLYEPINKATELSFAEFQFQYFISQVIIIS